MTLYFSVRFAYNRNVSLSDTVSYFNIDNLKSKSFYYKFPLEQSVSAVNGGSGLFYQ